MSPIALQGALDAVLLKFYTTPNSYMTAKNIILQQSCTNRQVSTMKTKFVMPLPLQTERVTVVARAHYRLLKLPNKYKINTVAEGGNWSEESLKAAINAVERDGLRGRSPVPNT
ncbi:unnamed protein product [Acanthoscelides obtectus]|uniref:Uncharacterized protein n=1 Tax=Acanthoscelides obtectus TaxID=200917 RepID=A0A9P0K3G0_ACAOB|nr:unnamed protein product [Acanthoscelides obtectus]CAK1646690.1 hypothetical protein AOBTE_LOCUS14819 [Acanthoscelides obtectus]